jgi:DNA-binding CsgD family transcriptional regulator
LPDGDALASRALWLAPNVDGRALEESLRSLRLRQGDGLAGSAWARREPISRRRSQGASAPGAHEPCADALRPTVVVPALAGDEVLMVIELYATGDVRYSERLMELLGAVGDVLGTFLARRRAQLVAPEISSLMARELEVLRLAAGGLQAGEIAEHLVIVRSTVKVHLQNIYAKLNASNRTSAVVAAMRTGLIE